MKFSLDWKPRNNLWNWIWTGNQWFLIWSFSFFHQNWLLVVCMDVGIWLFWYWTFMRDSVAAEIYYVIVMVQNQPGSLNRSHMRSSRLFVDEFLYRQSFFVMSVSAVEQLQVMASKRQYKEAAAQLEVPSLESITHIFTNYRLMIFPYHNYIFLYVVCAFWILHFFLYYISTTFFFFYQF